MKVIAILLATVASACADPRFVTLEVIHPTVPTNALSIAPFEVAELVSFPTVSTPCQIWFRKDGDWYLRLDDKPLVIAGPARIELRGTGGIATFKLTPDSYPPDKSLIILGGPGNGALVTLEQSTNLVDWATATNGTYTNLTAATFFRIRADRVP